MISYVFALVTCLRHDLTTVDQLNQLVKFGIYHTDQNAELRLVKFQ